MRREIWLLGIAALVMLAAMAASPASATSKIEIVFPANGTNEITVNPFENFTAEIRLTSDGSGISSYGVSVDFDERIQLLSATELATSPYFNFTVGVESTPSDPFMHGSVSNCEGGTIGQGLTNSTFAICRLEFTAVSAGESPILVGFFSQGLDGLFDNAGGDLASSTEFVSATVRIVPEPGTLLLIGAGTAGLAGIRKRV